MQNNASHDESPPLPLDQSRRSVGSDGHLRDEDGGGALPAHHNNGLDRCVRHACARKPQRGSHLLPARLPIWNYFCPSYYLPTATDKVSNITFY